MARVVRHGENRAARGAPEPRLRVAGALRAAFGALVVVGALALPARTNAADDEMVPRGAILVRVQATQEDQREGIATDDKQHPLLYLAFPDPAQRDLVTGSIERDVKITETLATYGLTDRLNLSLALPFVEIRQTSSLATASTDAALTARLAQLQARSVSGLGDIRLTLLHRPVFNDTDGFLVGYGVTLPGEDFRSAYIGQMTLATASPYWSLNLILHYTRYFLALERARLDLRFHGRFAQNATVTMTDGTKAQLDPPNAGGGSLTWEQEFDTLGYSVGIYHETTLSARINEVDQNDPTRETRLSAQLMAGNLSKLETGRLRFPFQAGIRADAVVYAFNFALATRIGAFFQTYF